MYRRISIAMASVLIVVLLAAGAVMGQDAAPPLATASAVTELSNQFGRTIVTARGNTFLVDSAPPLGHPSEEMNPVEAMMASLATCGLFIYEAAAQEMDIPLSAMSMTVQADFDARGLSGAADVDPHVQEFRAHLTLEGPTAEQADALFEQWSLRCPIYTTLIKTAPIEVTVNDEEMGGKSAEGLATATIEGSLSNQPGRAIVNVRNNYLIVDSVPPLGGPNLEVNPMDLLLAAQGSCGAVIMEKAAIDNDIELGGVIGTVSVDFDARGLSDPSIDPTIQTMRVDWEIDVEKAADAQFLVDEWLARCPIYNTLRRAMDVTVTQRLANPVIHQVRGQVVSHPATGAMAPIADTAATIFTSEEGATAWMHTVGLTPGNVYTAWWVIANQPDGCEEDPCSGGDFIGKAAELLTEVTYADGVLVGASGEAHFVAHLSAGDVENNPWFGNGFTNPTGAEIHLVINDHGPLIPEMADTMLNSYRGGCTDESLPASFPDTAKADGEPGPNTCGLVQAAVFQQ